MSSNVGLSTPRGSGTSGYVQRNLSALNPSKKPSSRFAPYPASRDDASALRYKARQPDAKILDHERLREIEVQVFTLRDKLEDENVDEEEIEKQCDELRQRLSTGKKDDRKESKNIKRFQVHELAKAKIEESERLRRALGIRQDYEEGSHWKRDATEERLKRGLDDQSPPEKGDSTRNDESRERRRSSGSEDSRD